MSAPARLTVAVAWDSVRVPMRHLVLITLALLAASPSPSPAQGPRPNLERALATQIPKYKLTAMNLLEAIAHVSSDFNLPIGMEWNDSPTGGRRISRQWTYRTVQDIVADIVASDPHYEIQVSNGVMHVRPV